jgi:hypothetical protein
MFIVPMNTLCRSTWSRSLGKRRSLPPVRARSDAHFSSDLETLNINELRGKPIRLQAKCFVSVRQGDMRAVQAIRVQLYPSIPTRQPWN